LGKHKFSDVAGGSRKKIIVENGYLLVNFPFTEFDLEDFPNRSTNFRVSNRKYYLFVSDTPTKKEQNLI